MHAFYTYASLAHDGHPDVDAIHNGLTAMGVACTKNAQTVVAHDVTDATLARLTMVCDEWGVANGANVLSTPLK